MPNSDITPPRRNKTLTVHTGMYGDKAEKILNAVRRHLKKYGTRTECATMLQCEIERASDNEIVIVAYRDDWYQYCDSIFEKYENQPQQIREKFANIVKGAVKRVARSSDGTCWHGTTAEAANSKLDEWTRDNDSFVTLIAPGGSAITAFNTIRIDHAYAVYEILLERDVKAEKYQAGLVEDIVGKPFDPVRVELENYRREETLRIIRKREADFKAFAAQFDSQYRLLNQQRNRRNEQINNEFEAAMRKLNDEIDIASKVWE